jgi:hypothetical protein
VAKIVARVWDIKKREDTKLSDIDLRYSEKSRLPFLGKDCCSDDEHKHARARHELFHERILLWRMVAREMRPPLYTSSAEVYDRRE